MRTVLLDTSFKWSGQLKLCVYATMLLPTGLWSQKSVLDSLQSALQASSPDSEKVYILNELSYACRGNQPTQAKLYAKQALALAEKIGYARGVAGALNRLGNVNEIQGDYAEAASFYQQSLRIRESIRDSAAISSSLNNLAIVDFQLGNYAQARDRLHKALQLARNMKDIHNEAWYLNTLGTVYTKEGRAREAISCLSQSLSIRKRLGIEVETATTQRNLGAAYLCLGDADTAMTYLLPALKQAEASGTSRAIAFVSAGLGQAYYIKSEYTQALTLLLRAIRVSQKLGFREITRDASQYAALAFAATGQYAEAYRYQTLFKNTTDSLRSIEVSRKVAEIQYNAMLNKKDQEAALQSVRLREQTQLAAFLVTGIVIALLAVGVSYRAYRQKQTANRLLYARNREIADQNITLEHTLSQLHDTQQALISAEKLSALSRVIANVSHELNSPLGAIQASSVNLEANVSQAHQVYLNPAIRLHAQDGDLLQQWLAAGEQFDKSEWTTREMREKRQQLTDWLRTAGIDQPEHWARQALEAGIDKPELLLPHIQQPANEQLLQYAATLRHLRLNVSTIQQSVSKTSKALHLLKSFDKAPMHMPHSPVELTKSLQEMLSAHELQFRGNLTVKANLGRPCWVLGNAQELQQVWHTLLSNAIQAVGGKGTVSLAVTQTDDTQVVHIADNGPGIPDAIQDRLFTPFTTTRGEGEGAGLSLYLSKKIVESHGGSIGFSSRAGETVFRVTLPGIAPPTGEAA